MLDLQQAREFLSALSSHDGTASFSFQTLYDKHPGDTPEIIRQREKELTRQFHGTLDDYAERLVELNENGAGVFVCVNRTDGGGLRGKNVDRIRSFFIDDDSDHLQVSDMELEPSIVVRSKRGCHFYWLTKNGTNKDAFGPAQKALAQRFQTDEAVSNLNRVMRVPGFLHNKTDPYLVRAEVVQVDRAYALKDLVQAFGIDVEVFERKPRVQVDTLKIKDIPMERRLQRTRGQLRAMGPAVEGSGGYTATIAACRVANDFAIPDHLFIPELLDWGGRCDPPWASDELERLYYTTVDSVNNERFEWGAKLLDSAYLGSNQASVIRGGSIPWMSDEPDEVTLQTSVVPDGPDETVDVEYVPGEADEIPIDLLVSTSQKRVIDGPTGRDRPALRAPTKDEAVQKKKERAQARAERRSKSSRIGVDVEDGDDDLQHSDEGRDPRDISWYLEEEYLVRRDDARCVYIYRDNYWQETTDKFIEKLAMQYTSFKTVEMKDIREATSLLLTRRHVQRIQWNQIEDTEIPLKNGILNFMTGEVHGHNPDDYLDRVVPVEYDPEAKCPIWERCLEDWLPGGDQEKEFLQQFFGYILMPHARYKKAAILFGLRDTGKSQICSVAKALAGGDRFTSSITPDEMDDPRKLAPIKGKALNMVADLPKNTVLADGGFKKLVSTGDAIQIDQKFTRAETYTPTAKHMFATNNLPVITDVTDAVFRRIVIVHFTKQIPEHLQDTLLDSKLMGEMSGILSWAVEGARKLYANHGRWPRVKSSEEIIGTYKLDQNPLYFFIRESGMLEEVENGSVSSEDLRTAMNEFNATRGYGRVGFAKLVDGVGEILPAIKRSKLKGRSVVRGLRWAHEQTKLELVE